MKKIGLIHVMFAGIAAGLKYYQINEPDLTWNMVLALVSLDFMVLVRYVQPKWLQIFPFLMWLFFYPNTFYMVTDIVHMHFVGQVLHDQGNLILFMLYVFSIFFGVLCGIEGVRLALAYYPVRSFWLRTVLYGLLALVSSLAIHIGRYARLNSWDVFTRPLVVVEEIMAVISKDALIFVLGFTFLQVMCLLFMDKEGLSS